jgi:hypothetical protein
MKPTRLIQEEFDPLAKLPLERKDPSKENVMHSN